MRMLQEQYRKEGKYLHNIMVFVDLEKAYERVPKFLIWWSLKGKYLHMVFVDFEKAYDRVPMYLIWWSLIKEGIP